LIILEEMATGQPVGLLRCLKTSVNSHLTKTSHQLVDLIFENSVLTARLEEDTKLAAYAGRSVESVKPEAGEMENWSPLNPGDRWERERSRLENNNKEGELLVKHLNEELKVVKAESSRMKKQLEVKVLSTVDQGSQCDMIDPTFIAARVKKRQPDGPRSDARETENAPTDHPQTVTQLFRELEEWGICSEARWVDGENVDFGKFAALQEGLHSLILK
jgi:hypothetical protein